VEVSYSLPPAEEKPGGGSSLVPQICSELACLNYGHAGTQNFNFPKVPRFSRNSSLDDSQNQ
jgi:hypothetical protein